MRLHLTDSQREGGGQIVLLTILLLGLFVFLLLRFGWIPATAVALLPLLLYLLIRFVEKPFYALLPLFVANYFVMELPVIFPVCPAES